MLSSSPLPSASRERASGLGLMTLPTRDCGSQLRRRPKLKRMPGAEEASTTGSRIILRRGQEMKQVANDDRGAGRRGARGRPAAAGKATRGHAHLSLPPVLLWALTAARVASVRNSRAAAAGAGGGSRGAVRTSDGSARSWVPLPRKHCGAAGVQGGVVK